MQITRTDITPTKAKLVVTADETDLLKLKNHTLEHFRNRLKLPGFRQGKAPLNVVEKNADQTQLQAEFLDEAVNHLYQMAAEKEKLKPLGNPQVSLRKFVPFSELEFECEVDVLGKVTLGNYKAIKKSKPSVSVTAKDVNEVIDSLKVRSAEKKDVDRAAKKNDQVILDFKGTDAKGEAIKGADGKDYPLLLGSDTFIPGFEDNLIGLKPGEEKSFTLTFPKDYGVKALANKKVTFAVVIKNVQEVVEPTLDDAFASKVGPFKTVEELKSDIKKQLGEEKQNQADRKLENEIIQELVEKSKLELPEVLIEEQIERLKTEVRQNIAYRGQTWQEMLDSEGMSEDEYVKTNLRPEAEQRVKIGLVLAEVSIEEKLEITPEELEIRMQILKGQYSDPAMQAELAKPEARREIASRMLTEKTVEQLVKLATSK